MFGGSLALTPEQQQAQATMVAASPARGRHPVPAAAPSQQPGNADAQYVILDHQLEVRLQAQAAELARKQQVIARLVDVAEVAQGEAAATRVELGRLQQVSCAALWQTQGGQGGLTCIQVGVILHACS